MTATHRFTEKDFLIADFPQPELADWHQEVEKVLRGRRFAKVLVSKTSDGIDIEPLYTAANTAAHTAAHTSNPPIPSFVPLDTERVSRGWDLRQQFDGADPSCNKTIIHELRRGVTSIELSPSAPNWTLAALRWATAEVDFELATVALAPHADINAARDLVAVIQEQTTTAAPSWLGLDPIGEVLRGGFANPDEVVHVAASLIPELHAVRTLTVDTTHYAEAGASEAQELAYSIATAVDYLRRLERFGVAPKHAAQTVAFRLSVGVDQFVNIAMLRAARLLWARVLEACGVNPTTTPQVQQVVTNRAIYSRLDPAVNILRATSAVFAAALGGADAVTVAHFNETVDESNEFARRIARNTQTVLIEEAHLGRISDAARGSWFVESLTEKLAARAWSEFVSSEAAGGIATAIADGTIATAIEQSWQRRRTQLHTREEVLTAVSSYPNLGEPPLPQSCQPTTLRANPQALPLRRLAEVFETLRDTADCYLLATNERPKVHLAALAALATHQACSTWVTNLLAVAGVVGVGGQVDGSASPLEAQARFVESGADVAVICAPAEVYAQRGAACVLALREGGAKRVIIAGDPKEMPAAVQQAVQQAGVDEFWYQGMDVVAALTRLQADLGLKAPAQPAPCEPAEPLQP
ncbi:MAG: methylmalonyl-CoA mutase [Acidimicrobiia bacterium]|nr:methylmalonyl-CoA mutase [Acidimicrobiia bacterium]MCY4457059.1 methylmalonyl-CoA mutase family protein [Acidimicrobiaceae bacterium]